ncbi:MAG TPA: hypothetical protein DDZ51_06270 [Planctomycetaceae bacterium]|nr:hypothetical protein [Planctomycetaceae bacterium]
MLGNRAQVTDCDSLPCDAPGWAPVKTPPSIGPNHPPAEPVRPVPVPPDQRTGEAPTPDSALGDDAVADTAQPTDVGTGSDTIDFGNLDAAAFGLGASLASAGIQSGSFSAAPTMTGDLFGGGVSQVFGTQRVVFGETLQGFILNGQPSGSASALLGFGVGGPPSDIFTTGLGTDTTANTFINEFAILEPVPPSNATTSPGPGFVFEGGTAVFLGPGAFVDGDSWDVQYSYARSIGGLINEPVILAGPDVATRRVKIAENFSPEVRDRAYMNYSYFNNTFGGLGDVNRWVLGLEKILVDDMVSVEFRLPMATTLGSRQDINSPGQRNYELGNLTTIAKVVMLRDERSIWTAGIGVTAPLADDSRLMQGNQTLLRIRNEAVNLMPFAAVLKRLNEDIAVQLYTQVDVDVNGNEISGDLTGGPLPVLGRLRDSTLMHIDASYHHTLLRQSRRETIREVIGNAELHYTGSLENAGVVRGNGLTVTDLAERFDVVNATFSSHWVLGDNVVVTPGMSIPLTTGTNRQFNFEAILQLNYLR